MSIYRDIIIEYTAFCMFDLILDCLVFYYLDFKKLCGTLKIKDSYKEYTKYDNLWLSFIVNTDKSTFSYFCLIEYSESNIIYL